ncbi:toMV resistance protein Tm-2(2)-like [Actinidia eriantha]|uniref:toMV resistance protein Tm-2(2)-like n=1 Tax=Actinidia eriantha TaxID=165200 RepID=UPI0025864E7F|nr:toMV resistance protein Tm-2(2)-like [Actinidia eriantha]
MDKADPIEVSLPNLRTLCTVTSCDLEANWLSRFNNLRKLGIQEVTQQIIRVLSDAPPISNNLENLRLVWSNDMTAHVQVNLNLSQYENLSMLRLYGPMKVLLELEKLPPNLTELIFRYTKLERDPMGVLRKLPKLKMLKFLYRSYMATSMVCSGGGADDFPQLEELYFEETDLLKLTVEDEAMPRLKKLVIRGGTTKLWVPDRIAIITSLGRLQEE